MSASESTPYRPFDTGEITAKLIEPFAAADIEEKNGMAYLPHEVVRERVIEATGNRFDWSIDQVLFRDDGVTRRPADRQTGEIRRPLSMVVLGTLTIPGLGARAGIGAHPLDEGAGEDAAYKSAESDAFKRAAMGFGVGLVQLYIETGRKKRTGNQRQQRPPARQDQNGATANPVAAAKSNHALNEREYQEQLAAAFAARDAKATARLIELADTHIGRWVAIIRAVPNAEGLKWVTTLTKEHGIHGQAVENELARAETRIQAEAAIK